MAMFTGKSKDANRIIKALGLQSLVDSHRVTTISFRMESHSIATVKVEFAMDSNSTDELECIFKKYKLVEINEDSDIHLRLYIDGDEIGYTEEVV